MASHSTASPAAPHPGVNTQQVYILAGTCLLVGLFLGYFLLGRHAAPTVAGAQVTQASKPSMSGHPKLTLEQMKQMADVQASTLIEKSKTDPKNAALLVQIAGIYQSTHQFKDAAGYFDKALKINPKDVSARTAMASCLYYSGDVDGAVSQLNQSLKYNPKDANSLFNLGMIKYQGKKDPAGAIATWEQLLKLNPNLDRKPIVEQMIAEARSAETKTGSATVKN
jgi:cytochrome c-type biogenesis protein CcmH/NrfG